MEKAIASSCSISSSVTEQRITLIGTFREFIEKAFENDNGLKEFVSALSCFDASAQPIRELPRNSHPAHVFIQRVFINMRCEKRLEAAIRDIFPQLNWLGRYGVGAPTSVVEGMVWDEIVGPNGIFVSDRMRLGFFLLAPQFHYPLHGHKALEVYHVVSGTVAFTQGLDQSVRKNVSAPGYCITPSAEAHSLQVGDQPALIIYCWTGNISAPTWWWEKDIDGSWKKYIPAKASY